MKKILKKLILRVNDIKIRNKLIILYFFCVVVPIIIINIFLYIQIYDNAMSKEMDNLSLLMDRVRMSVSTDVEQCIGVCNIINLDKQLNQSLNTIYPTSSDYVNEYRSYLQNEVGNFTIGYKQISSITIFVNNNSMTFGGNYAYLSPAVRNSDLYMRLISQNKAQIMLQSDSVDASRKIVSLVSKDDFYKSRFEKFIKIDLNNDLLDWAASEEKANGNLYLVNGNGDIMLRSINNQSIDDENAVENETVGQSQKLLTVTKQFGSSGPLNGWKLIGVFSNQDFIKSLQMSSGKSILLASIVFLFGTVILLIISYSIVTRLKIVSAYLMKTQAPEQLHISILPGKDEIGNLIIELNNGFDRTRHLIDVVYKGEIEKTKAELHALQSQIHPHFLYNTLNSIQLKCSMNGEMETAVVIQRLALLFRRIMSWQDDFLTVKEEVEFIADFLEIQKYRYEYRLSYSIQVENEALTLKIPKMILQPLVENASFHGIEMCDHNGVIRLIIRVRNNALYCIIQDNGVGISPEEMNKIKQMLSGQSTQSGEEIGFHNIYKRLRFYYEDKMQLKVISFQGKGTTVIIKISEPMLGHQTQQGDDSGS